MFPGGGIIIPGKGVSLETPAGLLLVGNRDYLQGENVKIPSIKSSDFTEVHLALGGIYQGHLLLEDPIRPEAKNAIDLLKHLKIKPYLLTGDHQNAGKRVANLVGIFKYYSSMTPEDKADWVRGKLDANESVLMVGDGINDAPALSAANVGCALAGGTDIALETSDLVLTRGDLDQLGEALQLARQTLRVIKQNLFWAFTYNLVAIPMAMSGNLAPVYAAAAMAGSSICVIGNSLRLMGYGKKKQRRNSLLQKEKIF